MYKKTALYFLFGKSVFFFFIFNFNKNKSFQSGALLKMFPSSTSVKKFCLDIQK